MIPFDKLIELFAIATKPWSRVPWSWGGPPTKRSLERIRRKLQISIPDDYTKLATACPSYAAWLAGIGEDYDSGNHILRLNRLFHDKILDRIYGGNGDALPSHFILLNHGHDEDCDCWDVREVTMLGEHPIVYVNNLSSPTPKVLSRFENFRSYIENFALNGARASSNKTDRRKAKRMIAELGLGGKKDNKAVG